MWSKPKSPLQTSLLENDRPIYLRTGDLLLVPTSDLDITLNDELWKHVAIVVSSTRIYSYGQVVEATAFFEEYDSVCVRQLNCPRPMGFQKKFVDAVASSMAQSYRVLDEYKEGFEIGYVLYKMGFVPETERLKAHHFSMGTPYKKIKLDMYSEHLFF
jgi:hypothetical protein